MQALRILTLFLALTAAAPAEGVIPSLVKDINPTPAPVSSAPTKFVSLGDLVLFEAWTPEATLWRSDGTAAGTYPLNAGWYVRSLALTPGRLFFLDYFQNTHLWVSDGSLPGTFQLTTVPLVLPEDAGRAVWVPARRALFFTAAKEGEGHGLELWRTDGTPGGTYEVADIWPGETGSNPRELTKFKGKVYFVADDPAHGPALWRSDGTAQGTEMVRDTAPGSGTLGLQSLHAVGSRLVFVGANLAHGSELWVSDGTTRGTSILKEIVQGNGSPGFWDFAVHGQRLYFVASASKGQELWITDGTPKGTFRLTNFTVSWPGLTLRPSPPAGPLLFTADDETHGQELWASDGTAKGTRLLRDICPGSCHSSSAYLGLVQGNLYFVATDNAHGQELWTTDGTEAGTHLVRDLCKGSCSSSPRDPVPMRDRLLFLADDHIGPYEIWATDGTAQGTVALLHSEASFLSLEGATAGDMLILSFYDPEHGMEPWCTDGTPAGTVLLNDLRDEDLGGSDPGAMMAAGGTAFFFADDGKHGFELWKSDGTAAGTSLASELLPGSPPLGRPEVDSWTATPAWLIFHIAKYHRSSRYGPAVAFPYPPPPPDPWNNTLWASQGTGGITWRLTPDDVSSFSPLSALGSSVYFPASDRKHGRELWVTNGTPDGTHLFADLAPGEDSSYPRAFMLFQGKLWFFAAQHLWRTDGTAAGTVTVGPRLERIDWPTVYRGRLWFMGAEEDEPGSWLWSTDGTDSGTVPILEAAQGSAELFTDGERLYLSIRTSDPQEAGLWASDGSAAGTRRVSDRAVCLGVLESTPVSKWAAVRGLLFYASDPDCVLAVSDGTAAGSRVLRTADGHVLDGAAQLLPLGNHLLLFTGQEIWQTDGTDAGTTRVLELDAWQPKLDWLRVGSRVFFPFRDPETGRELWSIRE